MFSKANTAKVVSGSGNVVALDLRSRHPLSRTEYRPVGAKSFDPVVRSSGAVDRKDMGNAERSQIRITGGSRR